VAENVQNVVVLILLTMIYYFINYKIMGFEVLLITGLEVTSVIECYKMYLLVLLVSHVECLKRVYIGTTFVVAVCK